MIGWGCLLPHHNLLSYLTENRKSKLMIDGSQIVKRREKKGLLKADRVVSFGAHSLRLK